MSAYGPGESSRAPQLAPPRRRARNSVWRRLAIGALVVTLLAFGGLVAAALYFGGSGVVEDGTWLEVTFSPSYPDAPGDRKGLRGALQPIELSHLEVMRALDRAATDPRIEGILLRPGGFPGAWAQANELRESIARARAGGKRVLTHADGLSTLGFHLAASTEKTVLSPEGVS